MLRYKPLNYLRVSQSKVNEFFCFLECTPNSNFSANDEDSKLPSKQIHVQVNCRKKFWCIYG